MDAIPLVVRRLVATEQKCGFVHFFNSLSDALEAPVVIDGNNFNSLDVVRAEDNAALEYQIVYDVMRSRNGKILFRKSYAERFLKSLSLVCPTHTFPDEMQDLVELRIQTYVRSSGVYLDNVIEQNVKILSWVPVAMAPSDRSEAFPVPTIIMLVRSFYPEESMYRAGAKVGLLFGGYRVNPNAKVTQAELRSRANAHIAANNVYEVLLVHDAANTYLVPEGSRSNYLLQRSDGTIWCSAEEDILVGITLRTMHRVVQACGLGSVQHAKLSLKDILECKALYILGTSPTIMPVHSVLLYNDPETRRLYEEAVAALGATVGVVQQVSDNHLELVIPVHVEQAAILRAHYFEEAASQ